MRNVVLGAVVLLLACAQGPKGESGQQGPAGPVGPTGPEGARGPHGPPGEAGAVGPAGPQGPPGPVTVIAAADGGSIEVDGGLVIVSGPAGAPGAVGPVGPQGPEGPVGATGPEGVRGPEGPPSGVRVLLADGGVLGVLTGTTFYSYELGCFNELARERPAVGEFLYKSSNCSGVPHVASFLAYRLVGNPPVAEQATMLGQCFKASPGMTGDFRLANPVRPVAGPFLSANRTSNPAWPFTGMTCSQVSVAGPGFAVEQLGRDPSVVFPPAPVEEWTLVP